MGEGWKGRGEELRGLEGRLGGGRGGKKSVSQCRQRGNHCFKCLSQPPCGPGFHVGQMQ